MTARLGHPGIVTAIDMGEVEDWWYAMELVEGISLGERVTERGALGSVRPSACSSPSSTPSGTATRWGRPPGRQAGQHPRGRVRRALADLGLAQAEADPRVTGEDGALGTPHYMSPEHARDAAAVDQRSDLWSLGATLFHALVGRPPFVGRSAAGVLAGVLHQRIPDPRSLAPDLSRGMALVLRKCLTRDPGGRYPDALALLKDLERLRNAALRDPGKELILSPAPRGPWRLSERRAGRAERGGGPRLARLRRFARAGARDPASRSWQRSSTAGPSPRTIDERLAMMQRGGADAPAARAATARGSAASPVGESPGCGGRRWPARGAAGRGPRTGDLRGGADVGGGARGARAPHGYSLVSQWPPAFTGAAAARARLEACGQRLEAGRALLDETIAALDRHRDEVRLPAALRAADGVPMRPACEPGQPDETWLEAAGVALDGVPAELAAAVGAPDLAEALASDRAYLRSRWRRWTRSWWPSSCGSRWPSRPRLGEATSTPGVRGGLERRARPAACGSRRSPRARQRSAALYERALARLPLRRRTSGSSAPPPGGRPRAGGRARGRPSLRGPVLREAELAAPLLASVHPEIEARLEEARACAAAMGAVTTLLEEGGSGPRPPRRAADRAPRSGGGCQGAVFQLREAEGGAVHRFARVARRWPWTCRSSRG